VPAIKNKKLETLDTQGFQATHFSDSDWARTSDLHPVKVALSQMSYGIMLIYRYSYHNNEQIYWNFHLTF
jgi:hypothetical protein